MPLLGMIPLGSAQSAIPLSNVVLNYLGKRPTPRNVLRRAGGPARKGFLFVDMGIEERISLRHFSGKYRVAEGAPGSFLEPGSWV